jgi:stage II sporulation protein D
MQATTPTGAVAVRAPEEAAVPPPAIRVGVLVDAARVSIGADSGLSLRLRQPGQAAAQVVSLPRATFLPGREAGRVHLVEKGADVELATLWPADPQELLQVDATTFRGVIEVRPAQAGALTVVDVVNLEQYLRGVVPNELSPLAFPQLEALKAQAVAARSYALAHLGDYAARGFDVCATSACQVYRGQSSENALSDKAVAETRGVVATWRGQPIHAYYTSTCGGHTEDGGAMLDDDAPYLRGVACQPERSSRQTIRSAAAARRNLPGPTTVRDVALLEALSVVDAAEWDPARLGGIPRDEELRAWTERLKSALHRTGCASPAGGALARRATFALHLVASLCWTERAERLLAPADTDYLLQSEDVQRLDGDGERQAFALLVHQGLLSPQPDNTLRPDAALTRAEALALLAGAALEAGPPALHDGELVSLAQGELRVVHGEAADVHPIDPALRLLRDLDGVHAAASELALSIGDRLVYVLREGRVAYLEVEQSRRGAAADRGSRYYNWEVRLTPAEVERAVARYGSVGRVRDLVPRRLGASGRVVELAVVGSSGELLLRGLKVRLGLGLRENLFVIDRQTGPAGIERYVFTGKGWGHGVGLCQVGAFGMAQAGSSYDAILRHYYSGIALGAAN